MPADMVRTDAHQLRPVAADCQQAQAVKVAARADKTPIGERYWKNHGRPGGRNNNPERPRACGFGKCLQS